MRQKTRFAALVALAFVRAAQPQAAALQGGTACTRFVTKLRELPAKSAAPSGPQCAEETREFRAFAAFADRAQAWQHHMATARWRARSPKA